MEFKAGSGYTSSGMNDLSLNVFKINYKKWKKAMKSISQKA